MKLKVSEEAIVLNEFNKITLEEVNKILPILIVPNDNVSLIISSKNFNVALSMSPYEALNFAKKITDRALDFLPRK